MLNKVLCRVEQAERDNYKRMIDNAQPVFQKLIEMLEEDLSKVDFVADEDFDNPSWALKQAFKVGYKKGLTRLLEYGIIDIEK
jgi:BMFP domain-containing protein YqiC